MTENYNIFTPEISTAAPKTLGDALRVLHRVLRQAKRALRLKARMTLAPCNAHYRQLRTTHHKLLLRVIGLRCGHGNYRQMSYAKVLKKTGNQSVEAAIHRRRLLFARALARQGDKRLPKRLLFAGQLEGEEDDFKAFGALHGSTPTDRRTFGVD